MATFDVTYKLIGGTGDHSVSLSGSASSVARYAASRIKERTWLTATFTNDDAQNKLNELLFKQKKITHAVAAPYLDQVSSHGKSAAKEALKGKVSEPTLNSLIGNLAQALHHMGLTPNGCGQALQHAMESLEPVKAD